MKENKRPRVGQMSMAAFVKKKEHIRRPLKETRHHNLNLNSISKKFTKLASSTERSIPENHSSVMHCKKCDFVYSSRCLAATADHDQVHKRRIAILKFKYYKNENVILYKGAARTILINNNSNHVLSQKREKLMHLLDDFFGQSSTQNRQLIVYIDQDFCRGVIAFHKHRVAAKSILNKGTVWEVESNKGTDTGIYLMSYFALLAYHLLTINFKVDVDYAVDRLWVNPEVRRSGIGTFLLESLLKVKKVEKSRICFSDPTKDGSQFGNSYFHNSLLIAQ